MRTKTERTEGVKEVHKQPHRFLGLYLAPVVSLPFAWLIHVWAFGMTYGPVDFHPDNALPVATMALLGVTIEELARFAYRVTSHRDEPVRVALVVTVVVLGAMFSWNVGTGPHYVVSGAYVILAWIAATVWSIPRLNVARKDSREDGEEKDGFWKRLGFSPKTKMRAKVTHDEKTGEPVRVDIDIDHAEGETLKVVTEGLAAMESAAAGPRGMSSAAARDGRADKSHATILLKDPFRAHIPLGPLSAPSKSIGEFVTISDYATGEPARFAIAGGIHMPTNTSIGIIGMTRSGKGVTEMALLSEFGSRIDWVGLYLNQAKGLQDVRASLPIIRAAVIAEDGEAGLGSYLTAFRQVEVMMQYRQRQLGLFGIATWTPRCASPDPARRPSRINPETGKREIMESMPYLTVWVGEADSILASGRTGDAGKFIASKALSLGIDSVWSLQNPDWQSMPTGLRAQIGLWIVHGLSSDDHASMVLSDSVRKNGAKPEEWGQTKPGQHYLVGAGVPDDAKFPVAAKTRFLVGEMTNPDGSPADYDTLNDRFVTAILQRNFQSAKTLAQLDRGSADATGGWWDEQVAATNALRADLLFAVPSGPQPQTATVSASPQPQSATADRKEEGYVPPGLRGKPAPQTADDDDEPTADEMTEMHEEAAEVRTVEGIELYDDDATEAVDLTRESPALPAVADEDDPLYDPDEEAKREPRDRPEALAALAVALEELLGDEALRDPRDPSGRTVVVGPGLIADRYPFKSRPWFSAELAALCEGQGDLAGRFVLTLAEDLGIRSGKYRLTPAGDHAQ